MISLATKTASLTGNKRTLIQFYNHYDEETIYKYLPPGFDRIQDYLDCLNEMDVYDLDIVGWEYIYSTEDDY